jgi:hypothetical protein
MGQAKQRGSFEERQQQAIERDKKQQRPRHPKRMSRRQTAHYAAAFGTAMWGGGYRRNF